MSNQGILRNSNGGPLRKLRRVYSVAGTYEFHVPSDHDPRMPVDVTCVGSTWAAVPKSGLAVRELIYGLVPGQRVVVVVAAIQQSTTFTTFGSYLSSGYTSCPTVLGPDGVLGSIQGTSAWGSAGLGRGAGAGVNVDGMCIVEFFTQAPYPGLNDSMEGYAASRSGL